MWTPYQIVVSPIKKSVIEVCNLYKYFVSEEISVSNLAHNRLCNAAYHATSKKYGAVKNISWMRNFYLPGEYRQCELHNVVHTSYTQCVRHTLYTDVSACLS